MQNPNPVNLTTPQEVRSLGWAAEARDKDGHLLSMQEWNDQTTPHQNAVSLADFVTEYATDCTITIFPENIKST